MPLPFKISSNATYAGMHWTKRKKIADLFHASMLPFRKLEVKDYPVNVNYIFSFKGKPLDSTNTATMAKMLEDGMVACGILEDDDWKHVSFTGLYTQKGDTDEVEIIIS